MTIDDATAWAAFAARDPRRDGDFVVAVRTTGIYCKPSCAARHPLRHNVRFLADGAAARAAGYRGCLRCRPDDVARDAAAVTKVLAIIAEDDGVPTLAALGAAVGYSPAHLQRLFVARVGVSPAAFARARRAERLGEALHRGESVTQAGYAAGYSGPARAHADSQARLGMSPSAWRDGGRGVTIRWAVAATPLGPMLLATTDIGICRLSFDEDAAVLRRQFPHADIVAGEAPMAALVAAVLAGLDDPIAMRDLPLDVAGTAFQERVWQALRAIPPGETRSYAQIAAAIGAPRAVRAVGSANGANHVAVIIPCHRVIRSDGSPGGYAHGLERKARLLAAERAHD